MSARILDSAVDWLALGLTAGVVAAVLGAATARSLYAMTMALLAATALAAATLLAHDAGDAALAQALAGVGAAPFVILGGLLLTARAVKPRRGARPWLTMSAACGAAAVILWALPDLGVPAPARVTLSGDATLAPWFGPLLLVVASAVCALIGYGERGSLERASAEGRS